MAENNDLDVVVGRNIEIERISQILSRRKKNNPVLIGEPGVGKTAIVEGLALRIFQKKQGIMVERCQMMREMNLVIKSMRL